MKIKKILSTALSLALLTSGSVITARADGMPFVDVENGDWFYDSVKFVYDGGIMKGVDSDVFSPSGSLTRAEFVTILCRMSGGVEKITDTFTDVPSDAWYSGYVGWGADTGVVNGYDDYTFRPDAPMSRQEMAAAMVRYIEHRGINLPRENKAPYAFTDSESIDEWASDYVDVLRLSGIVAGDESVNYNPQDNISRAEAATIIERLYGIIDNTWQGYIPSADDEEIILGAKYLYSSGTLVEGTLGTDLVTASSDGTAFPYPALSVFKDSFAANQASRQIEDATGISLSVLNHDFASKPIVKVCYKYEGVENPTLGALYTARNAATFTDELTVTKGDSDEGWETCYIDISGALSAHPEVNFDSFLINVLLKPFDSDSDGKFYIRYYGLFSDMESASAFKSSDMKDYLDNYFLYSSLDIKELTKSVDDEYKAEITRRVNEILNSPSELTPEQITEAGGTCWYVSSIHGDDSNDGSSPEKAFKSLSSLYYNRGPVTLSHARAGDGVFFERGSEWNGKTYLNGCTQCLTVENGVSYGAYGTGPKPLFTNAVDFSEKNNTGIWLETEWKNVYVLDEIDPNPDFCGKKQDIGNIVFDDGKYFGIRLTPETDMAPFGTPGMKTRYVGYCSNGGKCFVSGGTPYDNPGTALKNDLEYIHDRAEGKLYLYSVGGNPADRFSEIRVSRNGYIVGGGERDLRLDNLALLYSTNYGGAVGGENLVVSNCEVGYCNKSLGEVASGFETFGGTNGSHIYNSYFHEIGDGPMSVQSGGGGEDGDGCLMHNILWENNVVLCSGCGIEIWNQWKENSGPNEDGSAPYTNIYDNTIRGNILAYIGYGMSQLHGSSMLSGHAVNSTQAGSAMENCVFENNLVYKPYREVYLAYIATDEQTNGWIGRNNVYVADTAYSAMAFTYETVARLDHRMHKYTRTYIPFNERYLKYLGSLGADPGSKYYTFTENTYAHENGLFFMSSYCVERGLDSPVK